MSVDLGVLLGLGAFLLTLIRVGLKIAAAFRHNAEILEGLRADVQTLKAWRTDVDLFRQDLTVRERQALTAELERYRAAHIASSLGPRPMPPPFTD